MTDRLDRLEAHITKSVAGVLQDFRITGTNRKKDSEMTSTAQPAYDFHKIRNYLLDAGYPIDGDAMLAVDAVEDAMTALTAQASAVAVEAVGVEPVGKYVGSDYVQEVEMFRDVAEGTMLYAHAHAPPAVPVESLGRDAPDPVPLNAVRAALEAVDTGRTQIARDNLRILEIHLRAQSGKPVASVPDGFALVPRQLPIEMEIAFCEAWFSRVRPIDDSDMQDAWDAALNAAPSPTKTEGMCATCKGAREGYLPNGDGPYLCNECYDTPPTNQEGATP